MFTVRQPTSKKPQVVSATSTAISSVMASIKVVNGILCRQYSTVPCGDVITVPILPESLQQQAIYQSHDLPIAGHQRYTANST